MPDMKPSFALDLTEDGITLLHRTKRGWVDVGSVAFSDPDLGAALDYLRSTALGLSPKGMATKLIIPESQILYLQVDAPGPDDTRRRTQIETALDGRTPYSLDELAFDWSGSGPTVTVAVVARETLDEAEAFATEHRFNPVAFTARPATGFDKEPFFGPSGLAPTLLKGGEKVEPDDVPVVIIPREAQKTETVAPNGAIAEAKQVTAAPEPEPREPQPDQPTPDLPEPVPDLPEPEPPAEPDLPNPDLPAPDLPQPEIPDPAPPKPEPAPVEIPLADPMPAPGPLDPPDPAPDLPAYDPTPSPVTMTTTTRPADVADEVEAPMAVDVPQGDLIDDIPPMPSRSASVLSATSPPVDELPPPPSTAAMMAFASRRAAEGASRPLRGAETALSATGQPSSAPEVGAARSAAPTTGRPAMTKPLVERPAGARPAPKFSYDDPVPPPQRLPGDPPAAPASVIGKAGKGLRNLGNMVTAPSIPGTRTKKPAVNGTSVASANGAKTTTPDSTLAAPVEMSPSVASMKAAAQSLARPKPNAPDTIAKGLGTRKMPQRGKPRYLGLILTGILLLILAIVAAWSSFYLTRAEDPTAEVQIANADAGIDPEAVADGQLPDAEDEMLADLQDPVDMVNADASADSLGDADIEAPSAIAPEVTVAAAQEPVVAPEPEQTTVAVIPAEPVVEPAPQTGVQDVVAAATQPNPVTQDEIFLAGMDTPPVLSDPLVLPQPASTGDAPPASQMPPPPFGTVYQFDENGRIKPTAEGIVTPEGVMLVSGKPSVVPPARSDAVIAAAAALTAPVPAPEVATSVTDAALSPADTFAADPTLSAARPRVRPEGLAPEAAANDDDASLAPAEDSRFASLRPRLRPQAILAAGEEARRASEAASLAAQAAAVESAVASAIDPNLSPLAVSVSRVPAPRPRDLSRAVEAAVAAATRQPETRRTVEPTPVPEAQPKAKATARAEEEEADEEPEVVAKSAAPRIPTKANVAKQATFVNAINLSKINLIGVYGTQSKRYALVRQANGRYRKVQVGDNIDGGKVQAITASEVRYQKGGRMLTLAMPKG